MPSKPLTLRITHPDGSTLESVAEQDSVILGSGPSAGIQLNDPAVSNLHVMLKVDKNQVTAIDLGSEQGTCLGEIRIQNPVTLRPGDILRIGRSQVTVIFSQPSGEDRAQPLPLNGFSLATVSAAPAPTQAPARHERVSVYTPPSVITRTAANVTRKSVAPAASMRMSTSAALAAEPKQRLEPYLEAPELPLSRTEQATWQLLNGPLPRDAQPTEGHKALQVSMLWGDRLLAVEHFGEQSPVTVGDGKGNVFPVYAASTGKGFELARATGSKMVLSIPGGADVTIFTPGGEKSLAALRQEGRVMRKGGAPEQVELSLHERARVKLDTVGFLLRFVKPAPAVRVHKVAEDTVFFLAVALGCLLLAALFALSLALMPKHKFTAAEQMKNEAQYIKLIVKPQPKPVIAKASPKEDKSGAPEGAKEKGEEGKMGKPDAKHAEAAPSTKGTPDPNKHAKDLRRIHSVGLLGALQGGAASKVFGPGGLNSGINSALGGLKAGAAVGDARGVGGSGSRGTGTGGGGVGLGIGGLGTRGMGTGKGGYGAIDLGGKGKESTRIVPGKTTVVGGLPKDVIEKIIRQHQREIKYCYDLELQKNPDLSGKVAVLFIIDGSGAVSEDNVTETTLNNANAEQCMLSKIKRWKFPEPVGGGVVSVNFPWVFKPAGSEG